ncbi:sulfite exporter TauE/SafE family protein [Sulfuritalea sp.]|uniref:sulfite exporter TauE/SafE family protein n=1 Tax=Sulfuritalea sp. TaxID=2480090 RepID=UPI00286E59E0|nr:sulfite exporter TauE/SafE family protein [Sulfuritalea sp.]
MDPVIVQVIVVATLAGFIQGLSGFAFALVATSLLAWIVEPQVLAPTVVITSLLGQITSLSSVGTRLRAEHATPFLIGGVLGVPVGVLLLPLLDATAFRASIGIVLIVYCSVMLGIKELPVFRRGNKRADGGVGLLAGILGGATGIPGPPVILWCALRGWDKETQRATSQSFFIGIQVLIVGFYLATGLVNARSLQLVLAAALPIIISAWLGSRIFRRFTNHDFQRLIFGLLLISGIALVSSGL